MHMRIYVRENASTPLQSAPNIRTPPHPLKKKSSTRINPHGVRLVPASAHRIWHTSNRTPPCQSCQSYCVLHGSSELPASRAHIRYKPWSGALHCIGTIWRHVWIWQHACTICIWRISERNPTCCPSFHPCAHVRAHACLRSLGTWIGLFGELRTSASLLALRAAGLLALLHCVHFPLAWCTPKITHL